LDVAITIASTWLQSISNPRLTALNLSRPPDRLVQHTAWFELTKANRGGKLGTDHPRMSV